MVIVHGESTTEDLFDVFESLGAVASESATTNAAPTTSRAIKSSALGKPGASKPKANILGAKKTKLGAKKIDASALDFDEAEKKAREEAERKEKLGYDPDDVTTSENQIAASQPETTASTIHAPSPLSPGRAGGFGSTGPSKDRGSGDVDRLGMGVRKLGFGQVGAAAKSAAAPKAMGFGSTSRKAEGEHLPHAESV